MTICACGCGEEIDPQPFHKYSTVRFKPLHFQRAGLTNKGRRTGLRHIKPGTTCACGCGAEISIYAPNGRLRYADNDEGRIYVKNHHSRGKKGPTHYKWNGGRRIDKRGYVLIYAPDHPHAVRNYVFEHRLTMEQSLGRVLERHEHVHHRNEKRDDNRLENLELITKGEHSRLHRILNPNLPQLRHSGAG